MNTQYKYEYGGISEQDTSLERIITRAEESLNEKRSDTGDRVKIYLFDNEKNNGGDWEELIEIPTEDATDEPYLTNDWKICYNAGCSFLRKKNGNQVFCGKKHNPNDVFEKRSAPVNCPVKFKKTVITSKDNNREQS